MTSMSEANRERPQIRSVFAGADVIIGALTIRLG